MQLIELSNCLNQLYRPEEFADYIESGLLIEGSSTTSRGATAVSFNLETAVRAAEAGVDFLVVHHGHGFWDNQSRRLVGGLKKKVSVMLENEISLFAYHLPMDSQPEVGNNIGLLNAIGLKHTGDFLPNGNRYVGMIGEFPEPMGLGEFLKRVEEAVGGINFKLLNGEKRVQKVTVCTGGAAGSVREAAETGAQAFITGEAKEDTHTFCQDEKFNVVAAGHHRTEVFGPQALAKYLCDEVNIPTQFIDVFNPV